MNTPIATEKNVIKVATKQHKDRLYFQREDTDTGNANEDKRTRKPHQSISEVDTLKHYKVQFLKSNKLIFSHEYGIVLFYIVV